MGQSSLFHATYLIIYTHMYSDDVLYRWKYLHKIQPIYICVYIYMYVYMYIYIYIYIVSWLWISAMDVSELTVFSRSIVRKYYSVFTCIHRNHRRGAFQWLKNYCGDKLTCSSNVKVSSFNKAKRIPRTYSCLFFLFFMIELLEPR